MLPHPTLAVHYATPEAKPEFVNRLFDKGARHYDAVVDWGFLRSGSAYRRWTLQQHGLQPGAHLLDVACGTGLVAVEAARILGSAENANLTAYKECPVTGIFRLPAKAKGQTSALSSAYPSATGHSTVQPPFPEYPGLIAMRQALKSILHCRLQVFRCRTTAPAE